jgi:hypothetical protein
MRKTLLFKRSGTELITELCFPLREDYFPENFTLLPPRWARFFLSSEKNNMVKKRLIHIRPL